MCQTHSNTLIQEVQTMNTLNIRDQFTLRNQYTKSKQWTYYDTGDQYTFKKNEYTKVQTINILRQWRPRYWQTACSNKRSKLLARWDRYTDPGHSVKNSTTSFSSWVTIPCSHEIISSWCTSIHQFSLPMVGGTLNSYSQTCTYCWAYIWRTCETIV